MPWAAVPLTARPGVLVQVSGVGVVQGAVLMGGADGGWRDWWVAAVVAVSTVGEAAVVGVSVGAGDGVAGYADGGGWEGGPVAWWFVRVSWLSVDGAAFGGVLESWPGVLSAVLWFLVPASRGRRWFTGLGRW